MEQARCYVQFLKYAVDGRCHRDGGKDTGGLYALIFMDVQLPHVDGYAAASAIREMDHQDVKKFPIVAMTANSFEEDVRKAMNAGMNAHLAKTMRPERLYEILEESL